MSMLLTLLLVFAAAAALGYTVVSTLEAAVQESVLRAENTAADSQTFQFSAFTTPRKLSRSRLWAGYGAFLVLFLLLSIVGLGVVTAGALALAAAVLAAWIPLLLVRRKRGNRLALAEAQVLDLAIGLASGLRSGQALPAALEAMSGRLQKPMSEEIATVLREYRLGIDLPEALERLAQRVPCEDLTLLVGSIRLTQQAGGSLAEVLDKMVEMIRGRVEFQAKLKTMTSQGKFEAIAMSMAPLFVFLILFLIDRPLMLPLVTTRLGWITIVLDTIWVIFGFLVIKKVTTIEV